jgi:hypothetical protein
MLKVLLHSGEDSLIIRQTVIFFSDVDTEGIAPSFY